MGCSFRVFNCLILVTHNMEGVIQEEEGIMSLLK